MIEGYTAQALQADKRYDHIKLSPEVEAKSMQAVIPTRANRLEPREYDKQLCKECHLVECFILFVKHYRRLFSRFEKLSKNFLGFLSIVSTLIRMRWNLNRT